MPDGLVSFRVDYKELDRRLKEVKLTIEEARDRRRVLAQIRDNYAFHWINNYADEGGRYGKWKALAKSTQRSRKSENLDPKHRILERTNNMIGVFSDQVDDANINAASVSWNFTDEPPAWVALHHEGGGKGGRLPARPLFGSNDEDEDEAMELLANWFEEILQRRLG
jgi:hypothetical protein